MQDQKKKASTINLAQEEFRRNQEDAADSDMDEDIEARVCVRRFQKRKTEEPPQRGSDGPKKHPMCKLKLML
jgi:hypothetical protein